MGDASGPRHHGGDDHEPDGAPRHLAPGTPRTPRYVLAYGAPGVQQDGAPGAPAPADLRPGAPDQHAFLADTPRAGVPRYVETDPPPAGTRAHRDVGRGGTSPIGPVGGPVRYAPPPPVPHAVPTPGHPPAAGAGVPVPTGDPYGHGGPIIDDGYARPSSGDDDGDRHVGEGADDRYGDDSPYDDRPYDDRPYDDSPYDDRPYDDRPYHGDRHHGGPGDERDGGLGSSLRAARAEAMWRYRSAPLWVRITADVAAASLVLVLIVGISLALRPDDGPPEPTADRSPVSVATTVTTVATTTTTVPPTTTTTVPPTTTTTVPPTTTTAPPVVPPPTEAPTTVPPTTTTEPLRYRDCTEAWFAGALPLFEGDPGYGPHLDRDGDGEACEWDERRRG